MKIATRRAIDCRSEARQSASPPDRYPPAKERPCPKAQEIDEGRLHLVLCAARCLCYSMSTSRPSRALHVALSTPPAEDKPARRPGQDPRNRCWRTADRLVATSTGRVIPLRHKNPGVAFYGAAARRAVMHPPHSPSSLTSPPLTLRPRSTSQLLPTPITERQAATRPKEHRPLLIAADDAQAATGALFFVVVL